MKNPFEKEDNSNVLIAAALVGAIAAGTITYLYLVKKGAAFRKKMNDKAEEGKEKAAEYLKAKTRKLKKQKTDLHELESLAGN